MDTRQEIIDHTKKWIRDVIVGCNFCPFAANVLKLNTVHYEVENSAVLKKCLDAFIFEVRRLDIEHNIETSFLILPNAFPRFDDYLSMVAHAEEFLEQNGYEGTYQVASFHPLYLFANSVESDAANYTNRSAYPMLHLLREESIDKALENYKFPEKIPDRNINFAREKGLAYMKLLRDTCM